MSLSFFKGKTILVTGHTGFKGSWLCKILINAGANVIGYALNPPTEPNLFSISKIESSMVSIIGDIRDFNYLKQAFDRYRPELVIHLAAQPIVRDSYKEPRYTYETNVMGTVNVLECVRLTSSVKSFLNVTTDKVYYNGENPTHKFQEDEPLDGYDPYSNSKSCSELVTHCYKRSFFTNRNCAVSTARAGNVIGGGDFGNDRIVPDCIRAIQSGKEIVVRNPFSTRPYQHVLEPLFAYLQIIEEQYNDSTKQGHYNVGPDDSDCINTGALVTKICEAWGNGVRWISKYDGGPHEASFLQLNTDRIKKVFGWFPRWHIDDCVKKIIEWTKVYFEDVDSVPSEMDREIYDFCDGGL